MLTSSSTEYFTARRTTTFDGSWRRTAESSAIYLVEARNERWDARVLDNWPSEADDPPPDIPTSENTSEVDALKECIGNVRCLMMTPTFQRE